MFSQNNEEKKLDWMYKGPNSTVDREEYLLGRTVDKTLEQLNAEEKQKQSGSGVQPPKNHVEHECIPPSIRDYKKQQEAEQVDISAKLQEDPLVAIKKREEETRRQFLQNPIQLKKLQKALKAQEALKKLRKRKKHSEEDLDRKIAEKLKLVKNNPLALGIARKQKKSIREKDLDIILMHKFNQLKNKLSDDDMRDILLSKGSSADESDDGGGKKEKKSKKQKKKKSTKSKKSGKSKKQNKSKEQQKRKQRKRKYSTSSSSSSSSSSSTSSSSSDSSSDDSSESDSKKRKQNWGLVKSDGSKIPLLKKASSESEKKPSSKAEDRNLASNKLKQQAKRMTEEEKKQRLREMMQNAAWRDKERERNVKRYRESDSQEAKGQKDFDKDFLHKELLKSANSSSVESRIRSNLNNIQRSKNDMNSHFSRRH